MLVRAGSEIVSEDRLGDDGADRHWDGAQRTVVVIGSGMVLVIMAVESSRKAGAGRLRDSADASSW
jgi:hypothetical protein